MPESTLIRIGTCLASVFLFAHCSSLNGQSSSDSNGGSSTAPNGGSNASSGGKGGGSASGGASSMVGSSASGGTGATGGNSSTTGGSNVTSQGGSAPTGGSTSSSSGGSTNGGASASTAGGSSAGGSASSGGSNAKGGSNASGGAAAQGGGGATGGGSSASGGSSGSGGAVSGGAASGGAAAVVDKNGVGPVKPGDSKTGSREYLNFGDFRLLNNKWGSDELGCKTTMKVFANTDKSFGWQFDRGTCGGNKQKPDYPEIEFGIHPFGAGSSLATSPSFSSTTLLPLQIKDITSAAVVLDGLNASIQKASTWNVDFELWLSQRNPVTDTNPGVYAELITFWGWQDTWACDKSGSVTAGDKSYNLCHQDDNWGNGWRYYQLRSSSGSNGSFSGKVDVKALLDWLVNNYGFSKDLWVTRFEVGSELDDNTAGSVNLKNITFQINGTSKSAQFAQ